MRSLDENPLTGGSGALGIVVEITKDGTRWKRK